MAVLTDFQAGASLAAESEILGKVNADTFCTLPVPMSGLWCKPFRRLRRDDEQVAGNVPNAILAMGIFSINRHKQSDIFMKK
ncbi:hypothetical protein [Serratia entomophila]|uniref:hypothetical protein n=1 Tax=Serratia entomophila TaxID=42906 RepID=UPI0021790E12|nr:hypothetical protein [Serratia entomophila]CAI0804583.1 Uncharacterised protein [Serratia entomophila]CAI1556433.1 Uncharacterised protein [Serratia entomophila]CAI1564912.1 Uncharacterised protein [Serratia entomophila]CAI1619226.1 Uncharacterised protein [Serratia entomophila]CAI1679446.1 Uncharacterised protein [Serratia entomophila]